MAHVRVKFTGDVDGEKPTIENGLGGWHLLTETGDGEFTACGNATPEYEHKDERVEKGGITCKGCLEAIRFYKSIKL